VYEECAVALPVGVAEEAEAGFILAVVAGLGAAPHLNGGSEGMKIYYNGLLFKIILLALFVLYFVVYLFVPFFVTGMDFGPTMSSQVSLAHYAWEPTENRHIANWIVNNHVGNFPTVGISRDMFVAGIVLPVFGLALTVLMMLANKTKSIIIVSALACIWGLGGGLFVATDPVLAIGGVPFVLLVAALSATFVMAALCIFVCLRKGENHDKK